jgi:DNA modification methylase
MKIETRKIDSLQQDPNNARTHDARNLKAIASSLESFGQRKPIVIAPNGVVLAGNGTIEAAKSLGWTEISVAVIPADWDNAKAKAYALADNRTAELADWDTSILASQLIELDSEGWDISALGFDVPEPTELPKEDDEPLNFDEIDYITKPGDVWKLGNHRLLCGDATIITDYDKLLGDEKVDLVWTDPPYGVAYVGKTKDALTIQNDNLDFNALVVFLRDAFTNIMTKTQLGAVWYVAAPSRDLFHAFGIPLHELGIWKHTIAWVKDQFVMGRADYHYRHESIFYGWTPGAAHHAVPDRKQDTVWEIARPKSSKEHPTMKPIELITRAVQNSSDPKQIVLDPFGGSGSTLIACEMTNRQSRVMELDPKYCDVIVKRWENLTGKKAELTSD